jgi:hypothetical protein
LTGCTPRSIIRLVKRERDRGRVAMVEVEVQIREEPSGRCDEYIYPAENFDSVVNLRCYLENHIDGDTYMDKANELNEGSR